MRISDWSSDGCSSDLADAFLERVGALLQNDPKAVSLPPLPDLMRPVLAALEQESVEVTFVPDGGEESVTMTLGAYPVRMFTASGLIKNPENIRNLSSEAHAYDLQ